MRMSARYYRVSIPNRYFVYFKRRYFKKLRISSFQGAVARGYTQYSKNRFPRQVKNAKILVPYGARGILQQQMLKLIHKKSFSHFCY